MTIATDIIVIIVIVGVVIITSRTETASHTQAQAFVSVCGLNDFVQHAKNPKPLPRNLVKNKNTSFPDK